MGEIATNASLPGEPLKSAKVSYSSRSPGLTAELVARLIVDDAKPEIQRKKP